MKERPILFSGPMVNAIFEGRKTQTRRVIKPQPYLEGLTYLIDDKKINARYNVNELNVKNVCPYGQPGDRLWVRETWSICPKKELVTGEPFIDWFGNPSGFAVVYRATSPELHPQHPEYGKSLWKPSIHMPRAASRINLEIVSVRVERLQDISDFDAWQEGVIAIPGETKDGYCRSNVVAYKDLWESINGPGSWDKNPFVWAVEFRRAE